MLELPTVERCDRCRFWKCDPNSPDNSDSDPDNYNGHCHRFPPVLLPNQIAYQTTQIGIADDLECAADLEATSFSLAWGHPVSNAMNWCGEFRPSMAPAPADVG